MALLPHLTWVGLGKVRALNSKGVVALKDEMTLVVELNMLIFGWLYYFNYSNVSRRYCVLQRFVEWRFAKFVGCKH